MLRADADFGDQQQGADFVSITAKAVAEIGLDFFELGGAAGHCQAAVEVDAQARLADVGRGDARLDL